MNSFFCLLFTSQFPHMLPKRFSISTLSFHSKQPLVLQVLRIPVIEDTLLPGFFFSVSKEVSLISIIYFLSLIYNQRHLLIHVSCSSIVKRH